MSLLQKMGLWSSSEEEVSEQNQKEVENNPEMAESKTEKKPMVFFSSSSTETPVESGSIVGQVNNDIYEMLSVAIENKNLPGNDFLEFMQSLNALQSVSVDEANKFNMVFGTLSSSSEGLTKERLVGSIVHYLDIIDAEKDTFANEMTKAVVERVTNTETQIEQMEQSVEDKKSKIATLNAEIEELNNAIATNKADVISSKHAIAQKEADFEVTTQKLAGQILDLKSKIEQYIK